MKHIKLVDFILPIYETSFFFFFNNLRARLVNSEEKTLLVILTKVGMTAFGEPE